MRQDAERRRPRRGRTSSRSLTDSARTWRSPTTSRRRSRETSLPARATSSVRSAEHADAWAIPTRVRAIRLALESRASADRMAIVLRDPAQADSLVAHARARGIDYRVEASARTDSALFAGGLHAGTGVVIGPFSGTDGWWVARIEEPPPWRARTLDEVRGDVEARWRLRRPSVVYAPAATSWQNARGSCSTIERSSGSPQGSSFCRECTGVS